MPAEPSHQAEENAARVAAAEAAIAAVERIEHARAEGRPDADLYVAAASRIMDTYRQRIESRQGDAETIATKRVLEQIERELGRAALKAERAGTFRRTRQRELGSDLSRTLHRRLDRRSAPYGGKKTRTAR